MNRRRTTDVVMRLCCLTPCRSTVEKDRVDEAGIQPTSTTPSISDVGHETQQSTCYPVCLVTDNAKVLIESQPGVNMYA
uniref:Secreted protein n=1 Tax=Trichogramma kaykai TaxID=54128 RepID=A0ABD2WJT8_9HYME